jgi:hypothetical protein
VPNGQFSSISVTLSGIELRTGGHITLLADLPLVGDFCPCLESNSNRPALSQPLHILTTAGLVHTLTVVNVQSNPVRAPHFVHYQYWRYSQGGGKLKLSFTKNISHTAPINGFTEKKEQSVGNILLACTGICSLLGKTA